MEDGIPLTVREVNDRAYNRLWGLEAEKGDFACECGSNGCDERVELLGLLASGLPNHFPVKRQRKTSERRSVVARLVGRKVKKCLLSSGNGVETRARILLRAPATGPIVNGSRREEAPCLRPTPSRS
jgi:hypothetical protein